MSDITDWELTNERFTPLFDDSDREYEPSIGELFVNLFNEHLTEEEKAMFSIEDFVTEGHMQDVLDRIGIMYPVEYDIFLECELYREVDFNF